jgi:hypothetical protein
VQVKDILDMLGEGSDRVAILSQIFDRTIDAHKLDGVLDTLSRADIERLKRALGSLYTFDPMNPTGHYSLDMSVANDSKLMDKLLLISNEEGAYRSSIQLADTSQEGTYSGFRNEQLDGKPLKKKFIFDVPTKGLVEFDFTSVFLHGKCRNSFEGTNYFPSDYQLKNLCAALPRAPEPSETMSFLNLRLLVKPYLFTVAQARMLLAMLGQHPSIQTEVSHSTQFSFVCLAVCRCSGCSA